MDSKFQEAIGKVLKASVHGLTDDAAYNALGSWNSLQHVQLVAAMEDVYKIRFSPREIRSFRTVGELRNILASRGIGT